MPFETPARSPSLNMVNLQPDEVVWIPVGYELPSIIPNFVYHTSPVLFYKTQKYVPRQHQSQVSKEEITQPIQGEIKPPMLYEADVIENCHQWMQSDIQLQDLQGPEFVRKYQEIFDSAQIFLNETDSSANEKLSPPCFGNESNFQHGTSDDVCTIPHETRAESIESSFVSLNNAGFLKFPHKMDDYSFTSRNGVPSSQTENVREKVAKFLDSFDQKENKEHYFENTMSDSAIDKTGSEISISQEYNVDNLDYWPKMDWNPDLKLITESGILSYSASYPRLGATEVNRSDKEIPQTSLRRDFSSEKFENHSKSHPDVSISDSECRPTDTESELTPMTSSMSDLGCESITSFHSWSRSSLITVSSEASHSSTSSPRTRSCTLTRPCYTSSSLSLESDQSIAVRAKEVSITNVSENDRLEADRNLASDFEAPAWTVANYETKHDESNNRNYELTTMIHNGEGPLSPVHRETNFDIALSPQEQDGYVYEKESKDYQSGLDRGELPRRRTVHTITDKDETIHTQKSQYLCPSAPKKQKWRHSGDCASTHAGKRRREADDIAESKRSVKRRLFVDEDNQSSSNDDDIFIIPKMLKVLFT